MKQIVCNVKGHTALIVGYCQGKRGKVRAIVLTQGHLEDVALKECNLQDVPAELSPSVVDLPARRIGKSSK